MASTFKSDSSKDDLFLREDVLNKYKVPLTLSTDKEEL